MSLPWMEIDLYPTDLKFSVFSSDEVKKLSVVKVITGMTFDSLGRAFPGGLYDPIMGTYGKGIDPCSTCFSMSYCPGHFGHIELNALVYNPFFMKLIHDIMKISCLVCFRLQIKDHAQQILSMQLDLADAGFVTEAQDLEMFKTEVAFQDEQQVVKTEDGRTLHPKIAEMHELLEKGSKSPSKTKTSCSIRSAVVHAALQKPSGKKCMYCQNLLKIARNSYNKIVINITKAERDAMNESNMIADAQGPISNKVVLADECRHYLREIYKNSSDLLKKLFPVLNTYSEHVELPVDCFFMNCILVTPPKSRPCNIMRDEIMEHPQSVIYKNIIYSNSILRVVLQILKKTGEELNEEAKAVYESARGSTSFEKMYYAWQDLQLNIDQLLNVTIAKDRKKAQGLKQVLEKKEGLIRKHMMGKRVNYAARTVITPDPNINVEEVGIPDVFAKKLSYPVPVTSWNISELRKMVMNGPDVHPGANYIEDEKGHKKLIPKDNASQRESMAKLLLTKPENGIKTVHRHLLNGDILLLNRQPTLHKPSIMAHKARILQSEKTFRLHYSNCKAYNADFDGDEMNAHFPQSEVARSEAYNLVNVSNQYLVPKDGTPLGGLIQDHVISGVKISIRGRFFNKEDYHQLVYQGLSHIKGNIKFLPATILKPFKLWSGKQVLSTIIINIIPEGYPAINLTSTAKINAKTWQTQRGHSWVNGGTQFLGNEMSEAEVVIRNGELIVGVLDKQQYGATPYGLIHCMYELYGGDCSTRLLTSFTKLFTYFLQREGFTLGVHDILVTSGADEKRRKIIKECREVGNAVTESALELEDIVPDNMLAEKIEEAYIKNPKFRVLLDRKFKSVLDEYTNNINKVCLPVGLLSQFPSNNLQLMVLSGAKGSMVNTMQISCLLGQIELEGKRPPLMISGKSLPSFATFETSPKSGGFIDGRFMTGIQPQDFFFHCMAGREGLIDTAVKTSRSGYLQRCLIKHLEGLSVNYDLTVRDSDNTVVQFMYGEDGMDICKSQFFNMKNIKFLDQNADAILHSNRKDVKEITAQLHKYHKKIKSWRKKNDNIKTNSRLSSFQQFSAEIRDEIEVSKPKKRNKLTGRLNIDEKIIKLWNEADTEKKESYSKKHTRCPDPAISKYKPDNFYGAVSEYLEKLMETYALKEPSRKNEIKQILYTKSMQSMASPGEPVGLLAAQSIGEPSTQMTLNTFHFAGRGEMNVTLGIPRLREILMLASANIKTPSMDIPFKPNQVKNAEKLRIKLNRVTLADVLEYIKVKLQLVLRPERTYKYELYLKFLPKDAYEEDFCVKPRQILKYTSQTFFKSMFRAIAKSANSKHTIVVIGDKSSKGEEACDDDDVDVNEKATKPSADANDSSDDESPAGDDDATGIKLKSKKQDENEYDDPDDEEELKDVNDEEDLELETEDENEQNEELDDMEIINALKNNQMVNDYVYDKEKFLWCKLVFNLPMKYKRLDISSILKEAAKKSVVYEVDKIKRAITYMNNDDLTLKTDGINIVEMFKYNKLLDLNRLYTNDVHGIAKTYGIEAAARVIVKEVKNVFQVYGITVDPRHLSLIADYMTFDGSFKPLSRKGMEYSSSPLQQMSFESCLQFLKSATISGHQDELGSPSGRLMVGLPIKSGTGSFSLLTKIC